MASDANQKFPAVINKLVGDLSIVDPFYGNGTFSTLAIFGKSRKIRFLSGRLGDEEKAKIVEFETNLKKFKSEFKNIEMKTFAKYHELHDRYIIADNGLLIVGYGIKDLANKESFLIFLPKDKVAIFLRQLKEKFEDRWKKANNIS